MSGSNKNRDNKSISHPKYYTVSNVNKEKVSLQVLDTENITKYGCCSFTCAILVSFHTNFY